MKTKTERILVVMKILAFMGGIGFSIDCGSRLFSLIASFINPEWAKRVLNADQAVFSLRNHNIWFYVCVMCVTIILSALKATVWYIVADLLMKLKLSNPFTIEVAKKLEKIAYWLFGIWTIGIIGKIYTNWITKTTGVPLTGVFIADEYLFIAGIVYIISQIFRRGIEIQEENQLTV